jgi:glucuronokinase
MQTLKVLSVEMDELGINAGLQDRVIQTYGGCVYMNFDKELMERQGHGDYVEMDANKLPKLWLAYLARCPPLPPPY